MHSQGMGFVLRPHPTVALATGAALDRCGSLAGLHAPAACGVTARACPRGLQLQAEKSKQLSWDCLDQVIRFQKEVGCKGRALLCLSDRMHSCL